jgi:hypothetical protein
MDLPVCHGGIKLLSHDFIGKNGLEVLAAWLNGA